LKIIIILLFLINCISTKENIETYTKGIEELYSEAVYLYHIKQYSITKLKLEELLNQSEEDRFFYLLANTHFKLNEFEEAETNFKKAIELKSDSEEYLLSYSQFLSNMNKNSEAEKVMLSLVNLFPEENNHLYRLAIVQTKIEKFSEAYKSLKSIPIEEFSNKINLLLNLIDLSVKLNKFDESDFYYDLLKKSNSDKVNLTNLKKTIEYNKYIYLANQNILKDEFLNAEINLKKAIELAPKESESYILQTNLYIKQEKFLQAEKSIQYLLRLNSKNELFIANLANIYFKLGRYKEALELLLEYKSYFKNLSNYYSLLAETYRLKENFSKETFFLLKSLEYKFDLNTLKLLADSFINRDDINEAKFYLNQIKLNYPNDNEFTKYENKVTLKEFYFSIKNFISENNLSSAKKEYETLEKISPNSEEMFLSKIDILQANKETTSLEEIFDKSLDIFPKSKKILREYYNYLLKTKNESKKKLISNKIISLGYLDILTEEKINKLKKTTENIHLSYKFLNEANSYNKNLEFKLSKASLEKAKIYSKDSLGISEIEKQINENLFFNSNHLNQIQELKEQYKKEKNPFIIIKLSRLMNSDSLNEKAIYTLNDSIQKDSKNKILYQEELIKSYIRIGENEKLKQTLNFILNEKVDSFIANYSSSLIHLNSNLPLALNYINKSILIDPKFASAYLLRGLIYYKLGFRESAKENFEIAKSLDSKSEISYTNLGVFLYNDHLYDDSENMFYKLLEMNPSSEEALYYLSLINFKRKNLIKSEEFILKAIQLKKTEKNILAYIKILQEKEGPDSSKAKQYEKYLAENFPNSIYSKKNLSETNTSIEKYSLNDQIFTEPILYRDRLILNYGYSLVCIDVNTKQIIWRIENKEPYTKLKIENRIYALNKNYLDQIDLNSGKILWRRNNSKIDSLFPHLKGILLKTSENKLKSLNLIGIQTEEFTLLSDQKFVLSSNGVLLIYSKPKDGIHFELRDFNFNLIKNLDLLGIENFSLNYLNSDTNSFYFSNSDYIYKLDFQGNLKKSQYFKSEILELIPNEQEIFIRTNKNSYIMSSDFKLKKQFSADFRYYNGSLFNFQRPYLILYNKQFKEILKIKISERGIFILNELDK
jgi:predicted Zn-dependent protease